MRGAIGAHRQVQRVTRDDGRVETDGRAAVAPVLHRVEEARAARRREAIGVDEILARRHRDRPRRVSLGGEGPRLAAVAVPGADQRGAERSGRRGVLHLTLGDVPRHVEHGRAQAQPLGKGPPLVESAARKAREGVVGRFDARENLGRGRGALVRERPLIEGSELIGGEARLRLCRAQIAEHATQILEQEPGQPRATRGRVARLRRARGRRRGELRSALWKAQNWDPLASSSLYPYDPTNTGSLNSILYFPRPSSLKSSTVTGNIDLVPYREVYLHSSITQFRTLKSGTGEKDCLCRIPLEADYGFLNVYRHLGPSDAIACSDQHLRTVSFSFRDWQGKLVPVDQPAVLELVFLDTDPYAM